MTSRYEDKERRSGGVGFRGFDELFRQFRAVTVLAAVLALVMAACSDSEPADGKQEVTDNNQQSVTPDQNAEPADETASQNQTSDQEAPALIPAEELFAGVSLEGIIPADEPPTDETEDQTEPPGDDPGSDDEPCIPPVLEPCPATECGEIRQLSSVDELNGYLSALEWNVDGAWCKIGDEVQLNEPVEIDVTALPLPDWCNDTQFSCKAGFGMLSPVAGVTCLDQGEPLFCSRVRIENTSFRVRPSKQVYSGMKPLYVAAWDILGPCESPCAESELSCPNNTCWPLPYFHCRGCLGGEHMVCNCWNVDGPAEDGTGCAWASGDVVQSGHCKCGRCQ